MSGIRAIAFAAAAVASVPAIGFLIYVGLWQIVFSAFAAWMTGRALANTWRPTWQLVPYGVLLGIGDLFFAWAIAEAYRHGAPLGNFVWVYVADTALLTAVAAVAFQLARARLMVMQYPWIYRSAGPFAWRER